MVDNIEMNQLLKALSPKERDRILNRLNRVLRKSLGKPSREATRDEIRIFSRKYRSIRKLSTEGFSLISQANDLKKSLLDKQINNRISHMPSDTPVKLEKIRTEFLQKEKLSNG